MDRAEETLVDGAKDSRRPLERPSCRDSLRVAGKGHARFPLDGDRVAGLRANRSLSFFRPPVIEFFDPRDEQFRAWGDDRTTLDRLLALPGIRPALATHLCGGDGVLTLTKGILGIRRPFARSRLFDVGPNPETAREMVRTEWDLLLAASRLA